MMCYYLNVQFQGQRVNMPTTPHFSSTVLPTVGSHKKKNLFGSWTTVSFSTRTVLYAIRCFLPKTEKVSF